MRKNTKKAVCIFFAVLLLACSFSISAFAVDPVSASVIANSFAQAITAYGESHGVSMTFDGITSGNTDQIGQSVHDLWARFRAGQQTADDYDTIAAAVFPGLYNKVVKAGGAAVVGMSIAQEYMTDIDEFWNWLLSGPAEMVKVDNAYQWNVENGSVVAPVVGDNFSSFFLTPKNSSSKLSATESSFNSIPPDVLIASNTTTRIYNISNPAFYIFRVGTSLYFVSPAQFSGSIGYMTYVPANSTKYSSSIYYPGNYDARDVVSSYWYCPFNVSSTPADTNIPNYSSGAAACQALYQYRNGEGVLNVSVAPYVGDAVAKPVPIPDTDDPDYGPIPWAGGLDIPWNDTLFGDGTGTLTDAQKEAISGALDQAIEDDGTLVLEGDDAIDNPGSDTGDPPSSDPDDYGVIGLENIFPFCIPFDIYNFLSALAATPTAPHFTATLQLPSALGGAQTIDLDFDNPTFNQLAQLLRLLELLAFIVGLALLTRSMFIRG